MHSYAKVMFFSIGVMLIFTVISAVTYVCTDDIYVMDQTEITNHIDSGEKIEEICEHDYVITSEYDWFRESYRTVSKCAKCGHVVR